MTIRLRMYDKFNQPEKSPPVLFFSERGRKSLCFKNNIADIFFLFISMLWAHEVISSPLSDRKIFISGHARLKMRLFPA